MGVNGMRYEPEQPVEGHGPDAAPLATDAMGSTTESTFQGSTAISNRRHWLCVLLAMLMALPGCSRARWRAQADEKAYAILREKALDPRWDAPRIDLEPDARSRFADPYDPNCPPLPPDDPAAHEYMHCVYGKRGYKKWHKFGDTQTVENPSWLEPYGLDASVVGANYGRPAKLPEFDLLTLEQSVSLSYIHSRDYQAALETLYLAALQLTFQRFLFDVQFLGIGNRRPSSDNFATINPGGNTDQFLSTNRIGVNQLLPGGGQWAVELVNNTLWLFGGGNGSSTTSVLSFSLVQPLLANGGRRFALEGLTQSERDVLYALRNFARYRMGFFTTVVSGGNTAGIATGVPGVFTGTGPIPTPNSQGGYLGLLQQRQVILNQMANLRYLEERLDRVTVQVSQRPEWVYQALPALPGDVVIPEALAPRFRYDEDQKLLYWRGPMTPAEREQLVGLSAAGDFREAVDGLFQLADVETITQTVAQLQTQYAQQRIQLAQNERQYQDTLDAFKLVLGLPPDLQMSIDESLLDPFQLVATDLYALQDEIKGAVEEFTVLDRDTPDPAKLKVALVRLEGLSTRVRTGGFDLIVRDRERAKADFPRYLAGLPNDEARLTASENFDRDGRLFATLQAAFAKVNATIGEVRTGLDAERPDPQALKGMRDTLLDLREELLKIAGGLQVVQIDFRLTQIRLNDFSLPLEEAVATGLENRQDLMNSRATVMDARRRLEVTANQLQSILNVVVAGDVRTRPLSADNQNPFDFRADQSSIRAGVNFTAPVQLIQQRNAYRAAQIGYQQARRNYMRTEDQVKVDIRNAWRQLTVLRQNFELARDGVRYATIQLDIAIEQSNSPVAQGAGQQGLNILQALSSVLNAQNQLIQTWVQYETNRLNIHNFMGILTLDGSGFWTDPFYQERLRAAEQAGAVLPAGLPGLATPAALPPLPGVATPPAEGPANGPALNPEPAPAGAQPVSRAISAPTRRVVASRRVDAGDPRGGGGGFGHLRVGPVSGKEDAADGADPGIRQARASGSRRDRAG